MSSRCSHLWRGIFLLIALPLLAIPSHAALRVCADPNNLPYSNQREEGFENRIAELVAREMGTRVEYAWWAQRRGFVRNTLRAGTCDVIIGVPSSFELALTTRPYYRSSYVFVTRRDRKLDLRSFNDPRLRKLSIGVQLVGDDGANAPPAHALSNRGIIHNVRGYTVYGDHSKPDPAANIVHAVAKREVDVAVVWGPIAGYYAKKGRQPLTLEPVHPQIEPPFLPFVFDMSMGVRREDTALRDRLDEILKKRSKEIRSILLSYGVPLVERAGVVR